jgi:type IV secretory pathway VirJ component
MTVREAMAERAEKRKAASLKAKQEAMATARALKPEPGNTPFDEAAAQAEFADLDSRALTVWMIGCRSAPSGHVGGAMMLNADWLKAEQASFARSGVTVEIAENPLKKGEFALVRSVRT